MLEAQRLHWYVSGLEVSSHAARMASEMTDAPVYTVPLTSLTATRQFDAITAWEVLEHIADPREFMDAVKRLLTRDGIFALSVPNWGSPWMRRSAKIQHWPPYHLNFWTSGSLRLFLERMGLVDVLVLEKPFAWEEELGRLKWPFLPLSLVRSALLRHRGMHLYGIGRRP
jgi:SAM-dependent methyltransferase